MTQALRQTTGKGGSHDLDIIDPEHQQQQARMERQWQAAEDIDKDVNDLNTSINSLIQTFGLDPSLLDETLAQTGGKRKHGNSRRRYAGH